jgi:hypothetical protein
MALDWLLFPYQTLTGQVALRCRPGVTDRLMVLLINLGHIPGANVSGIFMLRCRLLAMGFGIRRDVAGMPLTEQGFLP